MAAGEMKTDRKLDILSRMAATTDADESFIGDDASGDPDESFASALDRSKSRISGGGLSDVFLVKPEYEDTEIGTDIEEDEVAQVCFAESVGS
jgi:hypothetical protein